MTTWILFVGGFLTAQGIQEGDPIIGIIGIISIIIGMTATIKGI